MKLTRFIKIYLRDRKGVAALTPTSRFGIRKVLNKIDFSERSIIVEYGPGDGVFSRELLKHMTKDSKLILIETNEDFVKELQAIGDQRLFVFRESAENISKVLSHAGEKHADYVISGIPFSHIPENVRHEIITNTHSSLRGGGKFLIYQYSHKIRPYLRQKFSDIRSEIEPRNFLPLFINEAVKG